MKGRLAIAGLFAAVILHAGPVRAQSNDFDRTFREAAGAFDEGRFDDAAQGFQALLDLGVNSKEVQFNLGNALYRAGHVGHAVLAYRRAWRLSPRDPDVQANLRFVMNEAEAVMAMESPVSALFHRLSLPEWWGGASAAWCLMWMALATAAVARRIRPALLRTAAVLALLNVICAIGVFRWDYAAAAREVVVTVPEGTQALYAPLQTAEAHFELPAGSILRVCEQADAWLKVSIDDRDGWIQDATVTPVRERG